MGYVLIAFSTSTVISIQMLLFYMFIYMISGLCFWYIILLLRLKKKNLESKYNKELSDLVLLKKSNKALAICLSLTMFSIAGIPPMIGFLAKMNVFLSVVGISFYLIALASITCSVVSTLCDITGTVYDIFNFLLLNEDRTIQCNGNLNIFRKVSSHG